VREFAEALLEARGIREAAVEAYCRSREADGGSLEDHFAEVRQDEER